MKDINTIREGGKFSDTLTLEVKDFVENSKLIFKDGEFLFTNEAAILFRVGENGCYAPLYFGSTGFLEKYLDDVSKFQNREGLSLLRPFNNRNQFNLFYKNKDIRNPTDYKINKEDTKLLIRPSNEKEYLGTIILKVREDNTPCGDVLLDSYRSTDSELLKDVTNLLLFLVHQRCEDYRCLLIKAGDSNNIDENLYGTPFYTFISSLQMSKEY